MPLTYTGRKVKPGGTDHPGIVDIAVGLSRMPRFAGQTRRWFSVLDHSLFCDELAQQAGSLRNDTFTLPFREALRELRLAVLLHDAHESMTGDVPTDWKGGELKCKQTQLDLDIMDAFFPGGWSAYYNRTEAVKRYDRRALVAEAQVVGPPVSLEETVKLFGTTDDTPADAVLLQKLLVDKGRYGAYWFAITPIERDQQDHPGVREFIKRVVNLL